MYRGYLAERPYASTGALNSWNYQFSRLYEPSIDDTRYYSQSLLSNAEAYSDTAIVVIGRVSGESNDQPKVQYKGAFDRTAHDNGTDDKDTTRTYLEISTEEEALLEYVGAHYDKVVVLINALNTLSLALWRRLKIGCLPDRRRHGLDGRHGNPEGAVWRSLSFRPRGRHLCLCFGKQRVLR